MRNGQGRHRCFVEFGYLVQNIDSFGLFALAEQELGRLVEAEDRKPQKEHGQGHQTQHDHLVPPAHVAGYSAACLSVCNGCAGGKLGVASVLCSSSVGDCAGNHDTNGLPHRQQSHEVAAVLWQELQRDSGVDRNIATKTNASQEVNSANSTIVVFRSSL